MPLDAGLRIDWCKGAWRVWDLDTGAKLSETKTIVLEVPSQCVNCDRDHRGFLIAVGNLSVDGDMAIIRRQNRG